MENKAYALAAGLFTLLLGAGVVLAAMWFSGETYEKAYYVVESRYPVTGLNEQAVVRYRGVDIGKVTAIRFDPKDGQIILIEIAIQSQLGLTRSTYAELKYQGVTGLSYVQLDDTGANPEPLPPASQEGSTRIPVRESLFSNLADAGQQALADAREVMKRVNALLSEQNQAQLTRTLQNLDSATRNIAALAQAMQPVAQNSDAAIADARKTFQQADKLLTEISSTNRELAKRLDAIERVATSAEKAGGAVNALANSVASETLPRINNLADELARTSRSLDRLASSLKEQPQSLVFGRKAGAPGPGEVGFESRGNPKR
jgi:phospholipid/cholesterol/gamma-HCH transport system substrate-binding protein